MTFHDTDTAARRNTVDYIHIYGHIYTGEHALRVRICTYVHIGGFEVWNWEGTRARWLAPLEGYWFGSEMALSAFGTAFFFLGFAGGSIKRYLVIVWEKRWAAAWWTWFYWEYIGAGWSGQEKAASSDAPRAGLGRVAQEDILYTYILLATQYSTPTDGLEHIIGKATTHRSQHH